MCLGFFAWYQGLARGGVARIGRLQLAQPALTLCWSALLLGEQVSWLTAAGRGGRHRRHRGRPQRQGGPGAAAAADSARPALDPAPTWRLAPAGR